MRFLGLTLVLASLAAAQPPTPQRLFEQNCASCHTNAAPAAASERSVPSRDTLSKLTPEAIYNALTSGVMRTQAASLNENARRAIAEYLTGKQFNLAAIADAKNMPNQCPARALNAASPAWNGWGADLANSRYQPSPGLPAAQVPNLKLKWSFGFPGATSVYGQPTVSGGRVFVSVNTGYVYSLDAATGCVYWSFNAGAGVRTAITIANNTAFFGDQQANAFALNATTGALLWKTHLDDHPSAIITGAPSFFENHLYVPVSSGEEGAAGQPGYACCTFRGSVVALNAANGRIVWKTYTIADAAKPVRKNKNGTDVLGPSGAGVWSAPTIDPKRRRLYVGTGDAYSEPAAPTTDAILALDLDTGKIVWSVQDTGNDIWTTDCMSKRSGTCPDDSGPDHDFGSPPILKHLANGKDILIAPQKSGNVWAHDPDNNGAVLWRTALVNNTKEFGGKLVWGGAADEQQFYVGIGTGGVAGIQLRDGERKWFTALEPSAEMKAHPGQDGPVTAIPGVVFSGGWDGILRALSTADGKLIWQYNVVREFETTNGMVAKGGSLGAAGSTVAGGMLFVPAGYVGVRNGIPGNILLAFSSSN